MFRPILADAYNYPGTLPTQREGAPLLETLLLFSSMMSRGGWWENHWKREIKKVSQSAASITSHHGFERGYLGEEGGGAWFGILTDELMIPNPTSHVALTLYLQRRHRRNQEPNHYALSILPQPRHVCGLFRFPPFAVSSLGRAWLEKGEMLDALATTSSLSIAMFYPSSQAARPVCRGWPSCVSDATTAMSRHFLAHIFFFFFLAD